MSPSMSTTRTLFLLGQENLTFLALMAARRENLVVPRVVDFFFFFFLSSAEDKEEGGAGAGAGAGTTNNPPKGSAATKAPSPLPLKARRLSPFLVRVSLTFADNFLILVNILLLLEKK